MEKVEFPNRTCREPVWKDGMVYNCEVIDLHPGPHASYSSRPSVEMRERWEAANPNWGGDVGSHDTLI